MRNINYLKMKKIYICTLFIVFMNMVNVQDNEGCSVYDDKRKFRDLLFD